MKNIKGFLLVLAVFLGVFQPQANALVWLDVTAKIDGSDWFEIKDNTWRWQHESFSLPEYHNGADATIVNGQSFLSNWSGGSGYLAYSDYNVVTGLNAIQEVLDLSTLTYVPLAGRGWHGITQLPNTSNGNTLRVYFDDAGYGSHDFYRFQIQGDPLPSGANIPEPSTIFILGSGLLGLAGFRRKFASF